MSKSIALRTIGKAIAFYLPRWGKLSLYTTNGILQIDINPVENTVRPAMNYSLVATCRMHNINPFEWLKDVFERMHLYTTKNIHELLPQNWKKKEEN